MAAYEAEDDLQDLNLSHADDSGPQTDQAFVNIEETNYEQTSLISAHSPRTDKIESNQTSDKIESPPTEQSGAAKVDPSTAKCWHIAYYSAYFDVDTYTELDRLKRCILPCITRPFFDEEKQEKPDLYGPFWIVSSLAFLVAAMGNLSRFVTTTEHEDEWNSEITKISEAATFFYSFLLLVPSILYFIYRSWDEKRGLVELISIYGYSLFVFVPACMLCVFPWDSVKWGVIVTSCIVSTWFLVNNLFLTLPAEKRRNPGYYILGVVAVAEAVVCLALKFYFFNY